MNLLALGETVTVLTAGAVADPYSGETRESWTTPARLDVPGVLVEPRPSGEPLQDARNSIVSGFTLYFPAGTILDARSRVEVRGRVHRVMGDPAAWQLGAWRPGLVVQTERVEG